MHNETLNDLRLPSLVRNRLDVLMSELDADPQANLLARFNGSLDDYEKFIKQDLVNRAFNDVNPVKHWMEANCIDVLTWHYKTRHADYTSNSDYSWFSGQVTFTDLLNDEDRRRLEPYPHQPSPYIGIFGGDRHREMVNRGGPICIALLGDSDEAPSDWREEWTEGNTFLPLLIPHGVTQSLLDSTAPAGDRTSRLLEDLRKIQQSAPGFVDELVDWMRPIRLPSPVELDEPLQDLQDVFLSIKVTRLLLKYHRSTLPRSTFVCPAYVGGDEVGGVAFACKGFVRHSTAIIGEQMASTILSYLRLREDALAHHIAEEMSLVDSTKRLLLHRVVHDLRHPAEALRTAVLEQEAMLKSIKDQLNYLTAAMDETLIAVNSSDRQQILSGKGIKVRKNKDSVAEFIADVEFPYRKRFAQQKKALEIIPIPSDWKFRIDGNLLREVFENILSNALEHSMSNGGRNVQINVTKQGRNYLIHVRDDGPGIPESDWDSVFRPFYRSLLALKGGRVRGQGLAIAQMLARAHGGELQLIPPSDPWKTDFLLTIPS